MAGPDFSPDYELRAKRSQQRKASPRAGRPGGEGSNVLSALGNARVARLLRSVSLQRQEAGGGAVDDEVARSIQGKRGTGQGLDNAARRDLEPQFGEDFSDVRVHADSEADQLNKAVQAEAFTAGRDIFFRSGNYNPGSPAGRSLLAHELTHVVQQRDAPPASELTVSSPSDASELEASAVAESMTGPSAQPAASVARQAPPDEEEMQKSSSVERAAAPEEEELQMSASVQREAAPPEEEELQLSASLQREGILEEDQEPAT